MERAAAIDAESNVEELIDRYPSTARVFVGRRMICVGCEVARFETVADVCEIYRQPLDALLRELRAAAEGREPEASRET